MVFKPINTWTHRRRGWLLALGLLMVTAMVLSLGVVPATGASLTGASPNLLAQAAPTAEAGKGQLPTLRQLFAFSPYINGTIILLSIFSVLLFVFFMFTITPAAMAPSSFVDEVRKLILAGKHEQAAEFCRSHRHLFAASIIQRGVENHHRDFATVMSILSAEGQRRAELLWNRISYLSDVANVAPMLGLLGTVLGMIQAFFMLDRTSGSVDSAVLSQGVGQAMTTTMFGLIVGILALAFYAIIKGQVTRTLAEVEQTVYAIADNFQREKS